MWDAPRYFWTGLLPSAGLRLKSDSFGQSLAAYLSPSPVPIRLRTHGANKRWFVSANIRHFSTLDICSHSIFFDRFIFQQVKG
jgi:hypothetical protein